jgi:ATP-binding cassette, subfamily B, bacterial PglK
MLEDFKKIKQILTKPEQMKFAVLLFAIIAMAFMQAIGVASVMPFIGLLMEPLIIFDNRWLFLAYSSFGFTSVHAFTIFSGMVMFTLIVFSNVISAFATWMKIQLSFMNNHRLSKRLLEKYLAMPYAFFLNQNSAELSKNVLSEVDFLTNDYILPFLEIITKVLLVIFILIVLLLVNIYASFVVLTIVGGFYAYIYWRINQKMKHLGLKRWETNKMRYKSAYEAFGGIKEIKVLNRENYFLNSYSSASLKYANYNSWSKVVSQLPRFTLEAIAFGGIIIYSLILLLTQEDARQVIPIAGLFAFAGLRLMPAMQDIFNSMASMRFSQSALISIHHDIVTGIKVDNLEKTMITNSSKPLIFSKEIKLDNVSYSYPSTNHPVLCNINLTIKRDTTVAFVGPTGAGKTTLVDIILGLLPPENGNLLVDDQIIDDGNYKNWQLNLGYVPQSIYLSDDTLARNIAFGVPDGEIDLTALKNAAWLANIDNFIMEELPDGFNTVIGERGIRLSGGQCQRIGIARSLYHDPAVLIFDEATSALDGITEEAILIAMQNIAQLKTMIIIAHRLTTIKDCDVIYMIDKGRIVDSGTYEDLIKSNKQFQGMAKIK